jgi:hypothetical protein
MKTTKKGGALVRTRKCGELVPDREFTNSIFNDKCIHYFVENTTTMYPITSDSLNELSFIFKLAPNIGKDLYGIKNTDGAKYVYMSDNITNTGYGVDTLRCNVVFVDESTIPEFKNTIETQQQIYVNSNLLGEPICPSIVYADVLSRDPDNPDNKMKRFIDKLKKLYIETMKARGHDESSIKHDSLDILDKGYIENPHIKLGISFMEYSENYMTLKTYTETNPDFEYSQFAIATALYQNLRLMSLGYVHDNLSYYNVLIDPTYNDFATRNCKCIIVNFQYIKRINLLTENLLSSRYILTPDFIKHIDTLYRTEGDLSLNVKPRQNYYFLSYYLRFVSGFFKDISGWQENRNMSIGSSKKTYIFERIEDISTIFNQLLESRVYMIDRFISQNKYKSKRDKIMCLRSYVDPWNSNVFDHISHNKTVHIMGSPEEINISLNTTSAAQRQYFDFDIIMYYVSKNPHLMGRTIREIIDNYVEHDDYTYGKFSLQCNMGDLYLNAMRSTNRFIDYRDIRTTTGLYRNEHKIIKSARRPRAGGNRKYKRTWKHRKHLRRNTRKHK